VEASPFDLSGKVAIVTGGGMGIGQALARGLAAHGASVVIADLDRERAEQVVREIEGRGGRGLAVTANVAASGDVDRMVEAAVGAFGTIDILVNNAGGIGREPGLSEELSLDSWNHTLNVTLTSAFLCSQRAGRVMIRQRRGKIVNVASVYGLVGHDPSLYPPTPDGEPRETIAYAAAKGGIVNLTRALAVYWARHQINVNAIAPGMVRTARLAAYYDDQVWDGLSRRTPLKRPATPTDMAGAVIFLASPASDFVTGQILPVDGGWTAW
jgi:NAD(P)-dependent dehydrogenase (short-subunit alcohol dehydrogenase family)